MGANKKTFGTRTKRATFTTNLRSMVRADFDYFNSRYFSLILDEILQLIEAPAIKPEIQSLAESLFPYCFQIFNNYNPYIIVVNNLFADDMIPVSLETSLPARNSFEFLLGRTSAFALESCPQTLEFKSISFDFISAKELPTTRYSNMVYSNINTQKPVRTYLRVDTSGKSDMQERPLFFIQNKQSSLIIPIQIFPIIFWNIQIECDGSIHSCKPNLVTKKLGVSFVKSKRHKLFENRFRTFGFFDTFKGLRSHAISIYNKLGREIKEFSGLIIAKMMKLISVVDAGFKSFISNVGNCFRVLLHSFKKDIIVRDFEFDSSEGFHVNNADVLLYKYHAQMSSGIKREWQFLPCLKTCVIVINL